MKNNENNYYNFGNLWKRHVDVPIIDIRDETDAVVNIYKMEVPEQNLVNKSDENSDGEQNENESEESTNISMVDLKNIIKQELASENI